MLPSFWIRPARFRHALIPAWLSICAFASGTFAQESGQVVFVLAGQSNMVGRGVSAELPPEMVRTPANVQYFLDGELTGFAEQERFGPEVGFAHELARAWPERQLVLIKYAVDATSLLAWAPVWDSVGANITNNAQDGPLYEQLLSIVASVPLRADAEFVGFLWMQGERDAFFPAAGAEYLRNLEKLVQCLREDLGELNMPFVLGQVNPPRDRWAAADLVREAQREAEAQISSTRLVFTDDLPKLGDEVHYNTDGQLELGRRFARAYLDLLVASGRAP